MDQSIMVTERLVASPIPPLFTTHAGRLLVFYLFFLPLALHGGGTLDAVGTFMTVLAVGDLCKKSMRDVADSLCLSMPSLEEHKNGRYQADAQPYWREGTTTGFE
jgi:hypothetical protein